MTFRTLLRHLKDRQLKYIHIYIHCSSIVPLSFGFSQLIITSSYRKIYIRAPPSPGFSWHAHRTFPWLLFSVFHYPSCTAGFQDSIHHVHWPLLYRQRHKTTISCEFVHKVSLVFFKVLKKILHFPQPKSEVQILQKGISQGTAGNSPPMVSAHTVPGSRQKASLGA